MSFAFFIYYCAVIGGWCGLTGWALCLALAPPGELGRALVQGSFLGALVAGGVTCVDCWGNHSRIHGSHLSGRVLAALVIGCAGGLLGAVFGQVLVQIVPSSTKFWLILKNIFRIAAWLITGGAIGASIGMYDWFRYWKGRQHSHGISRKVILGAAGGSLGGLAGGILNLALGWLLGRWFANDRDLWSPGAWGFVAIGLATGLFIGLAQVVFKEGWLRVESGFRPGREIILTQPVTTLGRGETCDVGLFGDAGVDRLHARIGREDNRFMLVDESSEGGTFLNDQRIETPTRLTAGDLIRVGNSLVRFGERHSAQ